MCWCPLTLPLVVIVARQCLYLIFLFCCNKVNDFYVFVAVGSGSLCQSASSTEIPFLSPKIDAKTITKQKITMIVAMSLSGNLVVLISRAYFWFILNKISIKTFWKNPFLFTQISFTLCPLHFAQIYFQKQSLRLWEI